MTVAAIFISKLKYLIQLIVIADKVISKIKLKCSFTGKRIGATIFTHKLLPLSNLFINY